MRREVAGLFAAILLAGCAADVAERAPEEAVAAAAARDTSALATGKGAIAGLLVDDRYRPLPDGLVLVQEIGRTTRSGHDGLFAFLDVVPGEYTLKADIADHEPVPERVAVVAGEYAEVDLLARRISNENGTIVTQEYSIFIACTVGFVLNGANLPCTLEGGDDSYSFGFISNLTAVQNITYLVTELKTSKEGRYNFQVRGNGNQYAITRFQGDYARIVLQYGVNNTLDQAEEYGENAAWNNSGPFQTALFVDHEGRETVQGAWPANPGAPAWPDRPCCGAGASAGIKAKVVQSVFVGPPDVAIETYRVYG